MFGDYVECKSVLVVLPFLLSLHLLLHVQMRYKGYLQYLLMSSPPCKFSTWPKIENIMVILTRFHREKAKMCKLFTYLRNPSLAVNLRSIRKFLSNFMGACNQKMFKLKTNISISVIYCEDSIISVFISNKSQALKRMEIRECLVQ